ncbi:hypothetical protein ElyMa_001025200, partial [Elysia marginata]
SGRTRRQPQQNYLSSLDILKTGMAGGQNAEVPFSYDFPIHDAVWMLARGTHFGVRPDRHVDGGLYTSRRDYHVAAGREYSRDDPYC